MPTFGEFETLGNPYAVSDVRSHVSTIWQARKTGAAGERLYAVKCYTPRGRAPSQGQPEEALAHDRRLEFLEGIKQIKKTQTEGGRGLAPIYALGTSETEAWYVTDFYPRKDLQAWIDRKGEVNGGALRHVVYSVVTACLALKRSRGCSHGNLKPSNVFLAGKPRDLRQTPLLLTDAYPAAPLQIARLDADDRHEAGELLNQVVEVQDLAAIGRLILQLVEGRLLSRPDDYNYPVARSHDWDALGKDSEYWLQWCNKLLNPQLSPDSLNLETLVAEFQPSAAAAKLPLIMAGVGVVCLVVVGSYYAGRAVVAWRVRHKAAEQVRLAEEFGKAVNAAQAAERDGSFNNALTFYQQAQKLKRDDTQVGAKIQELTPKAAAQANSAAERAKQERQTAEDFQKAVDSAKAAERDGNFTNALAFYQQAQKLKQDDAQVRTKIQELTPKAAEQLKAQAKKAQEAQVGGSGAVDNFNRDFASLAKELNVTLPKKLQHPGANNATRYPS